MMGIQEPAQGKLFYANINLEKRIRFNHPLRKINQQKESFMTFSIRQFGNILVIFAILLLFCLVGCSRRHSAFVYSALDPAYRPQKTDPVFVILPAKPSIRERQLVSDLKNELVKSGFNLVGAETDAKWLLALSAERRTYEYGINTTAVAITPKVAVASTEPKLIEKSTIYLYLFERTDFSNGKVLSVWEGTVSATEHVYRVYKLAMIKNVLDVFGTNFERNTHLSRDYVNAEQR